MYGLVPYFSSKLALEVPLTAIFPFFLLVTIYYIVGFNPNFDVFIRFVLVGILQSLVGMVVGIFLGTISPDV